MAMINGATTPNGFEGKGKLGGILTNYKNKVLGYNSMCASNDFAMKKLLEMNKVDTNRPALENTAPAGHIDIDS